MPAQSVIVGARDLDHGASHVKSLVVYIYFSVEFTYRKYYPSHTHGKPARNANPETEFDEAREPIHHEDEPHVQHKGSADDDRLEFVTPRGLFLLDRLLEGILVDIAGTGDGLCQLGRAPPGQLDGRGQAKGDGETQGETGGRGPIVHVVCHVVIRVTGCFSKYELPTVDSVELRSCVMCEGVWHGLSSYISLGRMGQGETSASVPAAKESNVPIARARS